MTLIAGTRLGHYEIVAPLGAGGMGEVYLARDLQLDREVAIKVLPTSFANNTERLTRFDREAKILATLNHPNIAAVYDVVDAGGHRALVMERAAGETLTAAIQRGPMPAKIALTVARQIAEALEAAHEKGIVHRDLKPGNVMVAPSGSVKVLDFGLAAIAPSATSVAGDPRESPTLTMGGTMAGTILGTASYMSPEQAEGLIVDKRADIWSYGAVLWEMLTGQRLFEGSSVSRVLADVLRMEIDFARLGPGTPEAIVILLRRCLDREVANRLRDIGEARVAIDAAGTEKRAVRPAPRKSWFGVAGWSVATVAIAAAIVAPWRKAPVRPSYTFDLYPAEKQTFNPQSQISPDGKLIALSVRDGGNQTVPYLAVRRLDSGEIRKLPGTESANRPAWSPDSRSLAFVQMDRIKRIDVNGGPPQAITNFESGYIPFLAWGRRNVILFSRIRDGLWQIPASGGTPSRVANLEGEGRAILLGAPQFLPDGRHFLYFAQGAGTTYIGSLDAPPEQNRTELLKGSPTTAYYARGPDDSDYLMFLREGALMAQGFDVRALKLTGEPFPVGPQMAATATILPAVSISDTGALLHASAGPSANVQLSWFDRHGKPLSNAGQPGDYGEFALSPDERRIAIVHRGGAGNDIWVWDLTRAAAPRRFTFDSGNARFPVWSADGTAVVFARRSGALSLYEKLVDSTEAERVISDSGVPLNWSRDGKRLLLLSPQMDLAILTDGKLSNFKPTAYREMAAEFSPDGKWIAYASEETGRAEIWVQTFPTSGGKWQISTAGGGQPRWSKDGREVYYLARDFKLMVVPVTTGAGFEYGQPTELFQTKIDFERLSFGSWRYAVSRDGRFLIANVVGEPKPVPLTIMTNWWNTIPK